MSLMKSDRTKAPKSDRIVGYSITRRTRRHTAVWVGACLGVVARGTDARIRLAPDAARRLGSVLDGSRWENFTGT